MARDAAAAEEKGGMGKRISSRMTRESYQHHQLTLEHVHPVYRGKNDASTDISRCSVGPFEVRTAVKTMPVDRKGPIEVLQSGGKERREDPSCNLYPIPGDPSTCDGQSPR